MIVEPEEAMAYLAPDPLDREIIRQLQYDGRKPYTEIASELDVSEGTIRQRVKRLISDGVLQIAGIADPHYLGWRSAAMVGISVTPGKIDDVAEKIAEFPEVSYLFMASGEFDLFVEAFCRDGDHFATFLKDELQRIPGVLRTQTFMILKMYKLSYRWGDAQNPEE